MDLVRDVLDNLVVDRDGREMGRVDGVVLEQHEGGAVRVAAIEIGPSVVGYRLHPVLGRIAEAVEHVLGIRNGRPCRIPFGEISDFGITLTVDRAAAPSGDAIEDLARSWLPPEGGN
jgi:hypothetical protein